MFRKKKFLRGDVIISKCPYDTDKTICKRILATEGDIGMNDIIAYYLNPLNASYISLIMSCMMYSLYICGFILC